MLFAANGTVIEIGNAPINVGSGALSKASFASFTWQQIGHLENYGQFGDASAEITFDSITAARTLRLKGTRNAGNMDLVMGLDETDAGQLALIAAEDTIFDYPFRVTFNNAPAPRSQTVTITNASPGVVSWTAHGLAEETPVILSTTGALPTGLTAATTYYVKAPATDSFSLSATPGGAAINTSSAGSGTHTATTQPVGGRRWLAAKVASAPEQVDAANNVVKLLASLWLNAKPVRQAALG